MNNIKEFGNYIREARLSANLTSSLVAHDIGITRATLSSIENGNANCSIKILFDLLNYFHLDITLSNKSKEKINRLRASRINSLINKKINAFIVMTIEQYADSINKSSNEVYKDLKKFNILKELINDYEDLHGMSTIALNQYLDKLLSNRGLEK